PLSAQKETDRGRDGGNQPPLSDHWKVRTEITSPIRLGPGLRLHTPKRDHPRRRVAGAPARAHPVADWEASGVRRYADPGNVTKVTWASACARIDQQMAL